MELNLQEEITSQNEEHQLQNEKQYKTLLDNYLQLRELFNHLHNTSQLNVQTIIRNMKNMESNLQEELTCQNKEHQLQNEKQYNQLLENYLQLRELFNHLHNTLQSNLQTILKNMQDMESNLQEELTTQNELHIEHQLQNEKQYNQLLENILQLRELLDQNPYSYLRLGDRITLIDRNGNTFTGVFIETTENEMIWVNTTTMSLSISNKKGLTISKIS